MRGIGWLAVFVLVSLLAWYPEALAQRGRGGGGFRGGGFGGGGMRGGGFGGAPVSPHGGYGGYSVGARSAAVSGPYGAVAAAPRRPNAPMAPATRSGFAPATRSTGTVVGPHGGTWQGGTRSGSYTTQRGTTINYGGAGMGGTGPGGGMAGRYVGGVRITTPGGQTITRAGRGGATVGPEGNAVGGRSSIGVATGPGGMAAGVSRSGAAVGSGGAVSGSARGGVAIGPQGAAAGGARRVTATGPGGAVTAGSRSGVAAGPYGAVAGRSRGVAATGPGGTVVAGSRAGVAAGPNGTYYASSAALRSQGVSVRRGFAYYNAFTPAWYARYPGAWFAAGWLAGTVWNAATWAGVSSYCGYPPEPVYYDYGSSVVYQGDTVYVNGDPAGTAEQYAQQAVALAESGREAPPTPAGDQSWQPLGVFALVEGDQTTSFHIFQLAINKGGTIRGNYYNALTDSTEPVHGSVDQTNLRVAWAVGDRKTPTYEAGIANLTQDETTVLVHFGGDRTQQFTLVRIEKPEQEQPAGGE